MEILDASKCESLNRADVVEKYGIGLSAVGKSVRFIGCSYQLCQGDGEPAYKSNPNIRVCVMAPEVLFYPGQSVA